MPPLSSRTPPESGRGSIDLTVNHRPGGVREPGGFSLPGGREAIEK
jgi:hypothetical protein